MTDLRPSIKRLVVDYDEPGWLTMDDDGTIRGFPTAPAVLAWVRRRDARRGGFAVTIIEWRNAPEGFVPPEPKASK